MIALFKRLNAWFISFVLIGVYGIGVGLARIIYIYSVHRKRQKKIHIGYMRRKNGSRMMYFPHINHENSRHFLFLS